MARPVMIVVAGAPGSGKSSRFPVSSFGIDSFNADARAAELFGSFHGIPAAIRKRINSEFENWIAEHIEARQSFALETTLRSPVTFRQAHQALQRGFTTKMEYVNAGGVEESLRRIVQRAYRGGHSASERLVRDIYQKSTANLLASLNFQESAMQMVRIYDNSEVGGHVRHIMTFRGGEPHRLSTVVPEWLEQLLHGTAFDVTLMQARLEKRRGASE